MFVHSVESFFGRNEPPHTITYLLVGYEATTEGSFKKACCYTLLAFTVVVIGLCCVSWSFFRSLQCGCCQKTKLGCPRALTGGTGRMWITISASGNRPAQVGLLGRFGCGSERHLISGKGSGSKTQVSLSKRLQLIGWV